jgi:hypothetical protein
MKRWISFISIFLLACQLMASAVSFKAKLSHSKVAVGQRFRITFTVNANGGNFSAPSFENFSVLSGPNQSSSMQYINGKVSREFSINYILQANTVGKFQIGPAIINSNGDKIESNVVEIEVVEELSGTAAQNQRQDQRNKSADELGKYVYIKSFTDKKSAYVGEKLTVTYKLYSRLGMQSLDLESLPDLNGFWTHDLHSVYDQIKLTTEYIDGEVYQVAVLKQSLLYPQRAGKLTIDPLSMKAVVQVKSRRSRSVFESMFGSYETKELLISSTPLQVDIKPLPRYKGEGEFSGAVGQFKINLVGNKENLKANEAIDLKVEISGQGNLPLISAPKLNFPPDLEVYDPETKNQFKNSAAGSSGKKTFNYLVIPRHEGRYVIEPYAFTYFDQNKKVYQTAYTDSLIFEVEAGDEEVNVIYDGSQRKEEVELLENDIRFIHLNQLSLFDSDHCFYGSFSFYLSIILILLSAVLLYFVSKKYKDQRSDVVGRRRSRARKLANKRLAKALKFKSSGDDKAFYEEIGNALYGYYADRYNMGTAELSLEVLLEKLATEGAETQLIDRLRNSVEQADLARYAPGSAIATDKLFENARTIIEETESLGR